MFYFDAKYSDILRGSSHVCCYLLHVDTDSLRWQVHFVLFVIYLLFCLLNFATVLKFVSKGKVFCIKKR